MKLLLAGMLGLFAIGMLSVVPDSFAHPHENTTITPLNEEVSLEATTVTMSVPSDNTLPWATVRGSVENPAEWYPVIIQFFKGEDPVHVAQVDLKGDDTYEYQFRVRNVVDGNPINIFEGDYTVKIFKVVESNLSQI